MGKLDQQKLARTRQIISGKVMMFDFHNRVIVVTGAAGNLGSAVVDQFLQAGGTVAGLDHRRGRLGGLFSPEMVDDRLFLYEGIDVTDQDAMLGLAEKIARQLGGVDVLVNTVGGFSYGETVYGLTSQTWNHMMDLNVKSFLNTVKAFVPEMVEKESGKIISVGAKAALQGGALSGAYGAAKSALLRLTESLAAELKTFNIQVNCLIPGIIDTEENREAMPNADFSKWVMPDQLAQVILFLASSASDAISGTALPAYGKS